MFPMDNTKTKKMNFKALYRLCPGVHWLALVSALLILLHLATRGNHQLMVWLSENLVRPVHGLLAWLCSYAPFSVAELVICLAVIGTVVYIIYEIVRLIRRPEKLRRVYIIIATLLAVLLFVYAGFCLLWGIYYYGDDFQAKSGLKAEEISVEQLSEVTAYFADLANEYSTQVTRDENGVYTADREAILARSPEVFGAVTELFPCLRGPGVAAKPFALSRILSYLDFTGFFFPFTAEANVNMDFPPSLFAATVAHELSHQRGVAKEQEANFVAVLASLEYGDADYCYSAALLAYTHLGNALYKADIEAWQQVYGSLNRYVLADFACNREYWKQFETPVQTVSNTVYEGFLQSYDQKLGLKSYGACVDLLVNYYYEATLAAK